MTPEELIFDAAGVYFMSNIFSWMDFMWKRIRDQNTNNNICWSGASTDMTACCEAEPGPRMGAQVDSWHHLHLARRSGAPGVPEVSIYNVSVMSKCEVSPAPACYLCGQPWSLPGSGDIRTLHTRQHRTWVHTCLTEPSTSSRSWLSESLAVEKRASSRDMSTNSFRSITGPPLALTLLWRYDRDDRDIRVSYPTWFRSIPRSSTTARTR